ncbi:hypothetical protein [Azotobacter beijerinckii]|uniref:Uncharacterized protein n=1 Tax=Azotobacter beijerinckii TaxID=170623 RepID=A0A1I4B0E4_9GAMM|nr:hypothetical protein [Azotobacter beijerinckii]SFB03145.1 hypothetical protein SAMN04244571_01163 [Azotobacter beijerinckii]SFK62382.1 hypothetical protein SAMN04244574_01278 [Azotobacter beijerinckii]
MKKLGTLALALTLLAAGSAHAAEVLEETKDHTTGKSVGGMNGMMIGAIGGPIGMLVGAGIGALFGGGAQEATGLSDRAYKVRTADGKEKVVRSSEAFAVGDKVETRGNRAFSDVAMADDRLYDGALSYRE